jgi:hypothetical protein
MDTYKIITQLTAKTDMISSESIKDNFKALLPILAVAKGWGLYGGRVLFNFKPDEDYPHKKPYEIETDVYNEAERVANVEAINKDIDEYNDWVDEQNVINRKELFEKIPEENWDKGLVTNVHDVKDLNLETKRYPILPHLSAWISAFQFDQPEFRKMEHVIDFGYVDDEELYKLKDSMKEERFVKRFNVHLFNYIQGSVKMAEKANAWGEDNLWFEPNREFVHWFQLRGINPDDVPSFDNAIIDLTYDEACEEAFDYKDWDESYVVIEQEMRDVIIGNPELFKVNGKLQYKKGYEIGCRYWTKGGEPIKVKQMVTASTRYSK